ncbi:MAG: hypothetical protein ACM34B_08260, partial [Nitrospira sp.]
MCETQAGYTTHECILSGNNQGVNIRAIYKWAQCPARAFGKISPVGFIWRQHFDKPLKEAPAQPKIGVVVPTGFEPV